MKEAKRGIEIETERLARGKREGNSKEKELYAENVVVKESRVEILFLFLQRKVFL